MSVLLALLGFASSETQAKWPPALAWFGLLTGCYYAAWIVEALAAFMPVLSIYFRTVGFLAVALCAHSLYRGIVHRDGLSFGGWLREKIK